MRSEQLDDTVGIDAITQTRRRQTQDWNVVIQGLAEARVVAVLVDKTSELVNMKGRAVVAAILLFVCPVEAAFHNTVLCRDRPYQHNVRRTSWMSTALSASQKFKNFEEMLQTHHDMPVLVSFHNRYCGPCKLQKKELRTVRDEVGESLHMFVVDTEKWPSLGARYQVQGLPTLLVFKAGEVLYRFERVEKAEVLVKILKSLI